MLRDFVSFLRAVWAATWKVLLTGVTTAAALALWQFLTPKAPPRVALWFVLGVTVLFAAGKIRYKQDEQTRWRRQLRSYVRAHDRLLTFVGALIVFTTFIVKDGLRDRLKDLDDSIERAETVFAQRTDIGEVIRTLAEMQTSLNKMNLDRAGSKPQLTSRSMPSPAVLRETVNTVRTRLLAERLAFDSLARLVEKMPTTTNQAEAVRKADIAKREIDAFLPHLDEIDADADQLETLVASKRDLSPATVAVASELNARAMAVLHELLEHYRATMTALDQDASELLLESQEIRALNEDMYSWVSLASYILYTVGWGLGLLTRLYGGESQPAEL